MFILFNSDSYKKSANSRIEIGFILFINLSILTLGKNINIETIKYGIIFKKGKFITYEKKKFNNRNIICENNIKREIFLICKF